MLRKFEGMPVLGAREEGTSTTAGGHGNVETEYRRLRFGLRGADRVRCAGLRVLRA